jgi:hypothetical protein
VRSRRLVNDVQNLFRVERFFKETVSPAAHGFERGFFRLAARNDDDWNRGAHPSRSFDYGQSFADLVERGRQTQIAQHDINTLALQLLDGFLTRSRFEHAIAVGERPAQTAPHCGIIVNHENRHFCLRLLGHSFQVCGLDSMESTGVRERLQCQG